MRLKRFKQDRSHCAVAACSSVANYYDAKVTYKGVKKIAYEVFREASRKNEKFDGLTTGQIGLLLNRLGFKSVSIITSDLDIVCYRWKDLDMPTLAHKFSLQAEKKKDYYYDSLTLSQFLSGEGFDNRVIIDYNFAERIRRALGRDVPIIIAFNWTMYFKYSSKLGVYEDHAVALEGYTKRGVKVVDSHTEMYKGPLRKYSSGRYEISWENLMSVMGNGDVIIPSGFGR